MTTRPLAALLLCYGCAPIPFLGPLTVDLRLAGSAANEGRRENCRDVARQAGVTLVDDAPLGVTISLAADNHLTIAQSGKVVVDEPMGGDGVGELCVAALQRAKSIPVKSVSTATLVDFINERVMADSAFKELAAAADLAQHVLELEDATPLDELEEGTEAFNEYTKAIDDTQNAHRRYTHNRMKLTPATFDTKGVVFADNPSAGLAQVPIQGTGVHLSVKVGAERVTLIAIESSKDLEIVTFDTFLKPTIVPTFYNYIVGDKISVKGGVVKKINRGKRETIKTTATPATTPVATPVSGGCMYDNQCKGDRVCVDGRCVTPR